MTKVKICGLMEPAHVQAAVEAGADAIGFVFAPSRRRITIEKARELALLVPKDVWKVGVFVNATEEELKRTFEEVQLDYIQYHGDESSSFIQQVGLPSIKAISVYNESDIERAVEMKTDYLLFDTPGLEFKGGSGRTFDWDLLENTAPLRNRIILAGGLHAENVREAIQQVRPFMVDVSSGVEINKRKDEDRIRAFIRAVKEEDFGDGERKHI